MLTAEILQRRIDTAEAMQSLVKTMKALAAVNINQFEQAVRSLADYDRTVQLGLQALLREQPQAALSARAASGGRLGVVVFGSDQGMCGQLNGQIARFAIREMDRLDAASTDRLTFAVGQRAAGELEEAGRSVEGTLPVPSSTSGITPAVQDLLLQIETWHSERQVQRVVLYYCQHLSGASYRPHAVQLLPIDRAWLERLQGQKWPTHVLPAFAMDPDHLFSALVRQYLFVSLYRALAESMASENASRLAAMQSAERNIGDRLDDLTRQFHQQRQTAITSELLDIAAGFEALTD